MNANIPKTAVIGATGFLGKAFLSAYRNIYSDCLGTARSAVDENRNILFFDLLEPDLKSLHLSSSGYKEALVLAGVTKIDTCEREKERTRKVNVDGTLELIRQLAEEGIKPIFFSSDYVFDGKDGYYTDGSVTNPITEYGKQKAEIESQIASITKGNFLVVRLGKIFSLNKEDNSLLDEMAHILSSGGTINAAFDQIFCPTLITDVIEAVKWLQVKSTTGIVNVCSPEIWSRYDLAVSLAKAMALDVDKVIKVSLDNIFVNPKLPKNTAMLSSVALKTNIDFTPMSLCVERVAGNWALQVKTAKKEVVIFGKNGNIGSALVESFKGEDLKLYAFGSRECDFTEKDQCRDFFKNLSLEPCSIIFLAAINKLLRNDYQSFLDNIAMVNNFVEAQSQLNTKHIIYFSSVDVYGTAPDLPISEETKINPDLWYGLSKYCCESILLRSPLIKCPVTILRLPGVYGNTHNDRSAIGKFICDIRDKRQAMIYGSGFILRDYLHVDDVSSVVKLLIQKPHNGILNLATGTSRSLLEIVSIMELVFPFNFEVIHKAADLEREFNFRFDITKIKSLFPEIKFKDLESGIRSYLK
ncbi:MAG: NAD-dependent epimerase/dehydratase family protein [Candidatus Omnitrophica bacterium]|nr:NAD-dependent epimerase/dehydratase family protein [Candidatus Omnitrophota bacterium]